MQPRVLIVVHRNETFDDTCNYFLREIAQVWREQGICVEVQRGAERRFEADVVVNHVDMTVVPVEYLSLFRSYPRAINGCVADISKRSVSQNLVRRNDSYEGPVIVKGNLNAGGFREAALAAILKVPGPTPVDKYAIHDRVEDVPDSVWDDPNRVVEKLLCEREGEHYLLRTWVFLGDRETNSLSYANGPIVKQRTVIRREVVDWIPDELRQMREELAFDYGKFDYGIVDGRVVLYDANRTPSLGTFKREDFMPRIRLYAEGLKAFL